MGRISYDSTEKKLRREFEEYGPIKSIRLVNEKRSGAHLATVHLSSVSGETGDMFWPLVGKDEAVLQHILTCGSVA